MDRVVRESVVYTRDMGKARKTGRVCRPCAVRSVGGGSGGELDVAPSAKAMYMYLGPKKVPVEKPVVLKGNPVQELIQNEYYVKDDTEQLILCTVKNAGMGILNPTYNLKEYNTFEITGIDWSDSNDVPKNKIVSMQIYQLTDEILRACSPNDWRLQLLAKIICNEMVNSEEEKDINKGYLKMQKIRDDADADLRDVERDFENTIKNNLNLDDEVDLSTKISGYEHAFNTQIEKETQLHSTHKDDMDLMMKKIIKLKVDDIQGTSNDNSDFKQDVIKIIQDSRDAFIPKINDFNRDFDNVILQMVEEYRKTNSGKAHDEEPILTSLTSNSFYAYKNEETLLYCLSDTPPHYTVVKIKSATTAVDITTETIEISLTDDLKQNLTFISTELLKSIPKTDWRIILTAKTQNHGLFTSHNQRIGKLYSDASKLEQKIQEKQIKDLKANIIIFAAKSDRTAKMRIADVLNAMSAVNIETLRVQESETISKQVSAFEQVKLYALDLRIDYLQSDMVESFKTKQIEDKIQGYITEWEPKISDYVAKYDDVISQVVEAWAKTAGTAAGDTGVGGGAGGAAGAADGVAVDAADADTAADVTNVGDGAGGAAGDGSPKGGTGTNVTKSMSFEIDQKAGNVNQTSIRTKLKESGGDAVYVYVNHPEYAGHGHYFQVKGNVSKQTVVIQKIDGVAYPASANMDEKSEISKSYKNLKYAKKIITSDPASNTLASTPGAVTVGGGVAAGDKGVTTPPPSAAAVGEGGAAGDKVVTTPPPDAAAVGVGGAAGASNLDNDYVIKKITKSEEFDQNKEMMEQFILYHLDDLKRGEYDRETTVREMKKLVLDTSKNSWIYILYQKGKNGAEDQAAGFVQIDQFIYDKTNKTMDLDKVWLQSSFRGIQGLGEWFVKRCIKTCLREDKANDVQFDKLHAMVVYSNEKALRFFMLKIGLGLSLSPQVIQCVTGYDLLSTNETLRNEIDKDGKKVDLTKAQNHYASEFDKGIQGMIKDSDYSIGAKINLDKETDELTIQNNVDIEFNQLLEFLKIHNDIKIDKKETKKAFNVSGRTTGTNHVSGKFSEAMSNMIDTEKNQTTKNKLEDFKTTTESILKKISMEMRKPPLSLFLN